MSWRISVPHRSRDESLIDVASHCRHLEGAGESAVARTIVLDALTGGMRTAGELLDHLGALEPAGWRELLNRARAACDLPSTGDVEAVERSVVASKAVSVRHAVHSGYQLCHGRVGDRQCNEMPVNHLGVPVAVNVCRWFCDAHRDQAAPGDLDPPPVPWRYSPAGAIVENDPAEEAREASAAESRRRQLEDDQATRAIEAAQTREHKRARDEASARELPEHLRRLVA